MLPFMASTLELEEHEFGDKRLLPLDCAEEEGLALDVGDVSEQLFRIRIPLFSCREEEEVFES